MAGEEVLPVAMAAVRWAAKEVVGRAAVAEEADAMAT